MLKVGITGGIGSGKSTVCQVFHTLGIPVLYADEVGRYLMNNDALVIDAIKMLFDNNIYKGGILDRDRVATIVFQRPEVLEQLNAIVHPATIRYGIQWMQSQKGPYILKEAAIFFESGSNKDMDVMIGVYAPRKLRILRAMERDGITQEKVLQRVAHQMDEDEKMNLCDHVIVNDGVQAIIPQVLDVHKKLLDKAGY
jgi:dephospho-CoA kinase